MLVDAIEGHRIWAPTYDAMPNPLLSLEMRTVAPLLGEVAGLTVLDAASGAGRWTDWLTLRGARVFGVDACDAMVSHAKTKSPVAIGDLRHIPFKDNSADLALCSFALGYLNDIGAAISELARVAPRVIISDIHPDALRQGWTRSFRIAEQHYELIHHEFAVTDLDRAADSAGLSMETTLDAYFGEPERQVLEQAGKQAAFGIPAVLITAWKRRSS
jgi:SAM-dependent methyltransferase